MEQYFNLKQAGEKLNLCTATLRTLIKSGELQASKIGRSFMISESAIADFFKSKQLTFTSD